jgi:hypothetical protein
MEWKQDGVDISLSRVHNLATTIPAKTFITSTLYSNRQVF